MYMTFADELKNSNRYCATFASARRATFFNRNLIPEVAGPTATVSFVTLEGRTYSRPMMRFPFAF